MPIRITLPPTFRDRLAESDRPLIGLWSSAGSTTNAEIVASSGADWVLIDAEHSPIGLENILAQLHAISAYDATPVVRVPYGDTVLIKQFLDLGAQNLLVPMVDSAEQAKDVVRAVRYPASGVRGVGSALSRSARWNRVEGYLGKASETISLTVQIESAAAVREARDIMTTDGVDQIFIGPSDLAASMGLLGQQNHPEVVRVVTETIRLANELGVPVGVNAFVTEDAERYIAEGANFVAVGADVALLARSTEALVARFSTGESDTPRASY